MPFDVPKSDFNALLAQMIAKSRLQQAPLARHQTFFPGGGGGGIVNVNNQTATNLGAEVNLKPIAEFFGYQSPKEKRDYAQQAMEFFNLRMTPEHREAAYQSPELQKQLGDWAKSGSAYVWKNPQSNRFEFLPVSEETRQAATVGKPTEASIAGGFFGPERAKTFAETHRAMQQPTAAGILGASEAGRQAVLSGAQQDVERSKQAVKESEAKARHLDAETSLIPAQRAQMDAHAKLYAAQADELAKGMGREQKAFVLNEMSNFKALETKLVGDAFSSKDSELRRGKIRELGNYTVGHIERLKSIGENGAKMGAGAAATYINMTSQELTRMPMPKAGLLGGPAILGASDEQAGRIFLNDTVRILQAMGSSTPPQIIHQMLDNSTEIAKRIQLTDDTAAIFLKLIQVGQVAGYDTAKLVNAIKSRAPRKAPVTPAEENPQLTP
jgi:hypothetical protein